MFDWIEANSTLITAGVQLVTAAIWIVYLHIFIVSFRRQRRSNILINRIAGNHDRAHLLVGNMGAEPIYVTAVIVDVTADGKTDTAVVTEDLFDADEPEEGGVLNMSRQGPLKSAETRDIGALGDLLERALADIGPEIRPEEVEEVCVTVTAEGSYDRHVVAGRQGYWVHHGTERRHFLPKENQTRQIRARRERRALSRQLDMALRHEAETVRQGDAEAAR